MPHLQFDLTAALDAPDAQAFIAWVTDEYADVMDTGTGHIAVTIREVPRSHLALGRTETPDADVAVVNADVRAGRSVEQRREFAVTVMDELATRTGIPTEHMYVVYTEHQGADFMLRERMLESWGPGDSPIDE